MPAVTITTVIPTYNEGDRLFSFLQDWAATAINSPGLRATAVVVDDGSRDKDVARQQDAVAAASRTLQQSASPHRITYVRSDRNRGKGAAIRLGWNQADADAMWLGFIDADGAVPAREYWRVASTLPAAEADALCGSRVNMAGRSVSRSLFRHLQGRTFATFIEQLFHLGLYDTQCGFKYFRASALRPILPALHEDRWLLDVEVLANLKAAGATLQEVPIDCHERGGSSLVFGLDPLKMGIRLVRLRRRLRRGAGGHA
jgi:glycosyltransferase involved in cell wall biosynthesis